MGLYARVSLDGDAVTLQHRMLLQAAGRAVGLDTILIAQGSWADGSLSAGTHDGSGAADVRIVNMPADKRVPFVVECRRRGAGATWVRTPEFGWPKGPHIHSLLGCGDAGDDPGLSPSAKRQVAQWAAGRNGLANGARDPHPRPKVWPIVRMSAVGYGKRGLAVLRVQRALAKYVGLNYATGPGVWGKRTRAAWLEASAQSGLTGIELLAFLGYRYGFRPAP